MLLSTPPLTSMLPTPPLATPKLMVPDILPGISCFISFVYHNLRSANAAPFYYGSCPYTDVAVYSSPYFHDGYTYANAAFLYGAYGNAAPSTMVAAFTLKMLATPPLATPMLMVPDILPGISCFISFVYHNLRSANAASFYYGSYTYTDGAGYSTPYFHSGSSCAHNSGLYCGNVCLWHGTGSETYVEVKNKNKTKKE